MSKVIAKALDAARAAALAGKTDEALAALEALAEKGESSAAASLAELYAFRGDWARVVKNAQIALEDPDQSGSAEVHDAMIQLLGAAGHAGRPWSEISSAAKSALAQKPADALAELLENLAQYASREGKAPHELIYIFGVDEPQPSAEKYRLAMDAHEKARAKKSPAEWARHAFSLAASYRQKEDMIRLYREHSAHLGLPQALDVALLLAERGELDDAWATIAPKLGDFWPDDPAQVTPIKLIADRTLRALATPERWSTVLSTPRGPGAKAPSPAKEPPPKKKPATKK